MLERLNRTFPILILWENDSTLRSYLSEPVAFIAPPQSQLMLFCDFPAFDGGGTDARDNTHPICLPWNESTAELLTPGRRQYVLAF